MSKTINISQFGKNQVNSKVKIGGKQPRKKNISSKIKQSATEVRGRLLQKLKDKSIEKSNHVKQEETQKITSNEIETPAPENSIPQPNMFQETTNFLDSLVSKRNKRKEMIKMRENSVRTKRHTLKNNREPSFEHKHNNPNPSLIIKDTITHPYTRKQESTHIEIKPHYAPSPGPPSMKAPSMKAPSMKAPSMKMKRHPILLSNIEQFEVKPDPPYGVLKNGNKKTYRQYFNKPLAFDDDNIALRPNSPTLEPPPTPMKSNKPAEIFFPETRAEKLERYKNMCSKRKRTYTIKRNFKLGINKCNNSVSFIKKNKTMKNRYLRTLDDINTVPISDKKIYLRKKGLINTGSELPNDLLCEMYKDTVLCGDINNKSVNDLNIQIE